MTVFEPAKGPASVHKIAAPRASVGPMIGSDKPADISALGKIEIVAAVAAWTLLAFLAYATISPLGARPTLPYSTSLEHIAAFAAVGLLFRVGYPRRLVLVCLIVVSSAGLLELLQLITPDRHARLFDAAEKMAGGIIGIIAGHAAFYVEQLVRRRWI